MMVAYDRSDALTSSGKRLSASTIKSICTVLNEVFMKRLNWKCLSRFDGLDECTESPLSQCRPELSNRLHNKLDFTYCGVGRTIEACAEESEAKLLNKKV